GQLVNGMADLLASTTGPQIQISISVPDDLPPARADPNQLEMALLNLGVNARDAMPTGGVLRITVMRDVVSRPKGELRAGDYICLSVADTGSGMDEATLARAVEPFFSTKGIGKGTGLGLSMVHGLAAQLGGALTMQSRPDLGTNVRLWLPVSTGPVEHAPVERRAGPAHSARGLVLLVDDEEGVRTSTAAMLIDLGYDVREAESAEVAMAVVRDGLRPAVLVTDHLMPGMTGVDLVDAIRDILPDLPTLIVSGYAEVEGLPPTLPRLAKPFKAADLAASLSVITAAGGGLA
ncbi:MAG TPA: ATP-binding protein, partial [Brevundimonas sp.]|nr:ATP-binding protein [Brevundimonas sp.]